MEPGGHRWFSWSSSLRARVSHWSRRSMSGRPTSPSATASSSGRGAGRSVSSMTRATPSVNLTQRSTVVHVGRFTPHPLACHAPASGDGRDGVDFGLREHVRLVAGADADLAAGGGREPDGRGRFLLGAHVPLRDEVGGPPLGALVASDDVQHGVVVLLVDGQGGRRGRRGWGSEPGSDAGESGVQVPAGARGRGAWGVPVAAEGRYPPAPIGAVAGEPDERVERLLGRGPVVEVAEEADGVRAGVVAGGVPAGDAGTAAFVDGAVVPDEEAVGDVGPPAGAHVERLVCAYGGGALAVVGGVVDPQAGRGGGDAVDALGRAGAPLGQGVDRGHQAAPQYHGIVRNCGVNRRTSRPDTST